MSVEAIKQRHAELKRRRAEVCRHGLAPDLCHPCQADGRPLAVPAASESPPTASVARPLGRQGRAVLAAARAIGGPFTLEALAVRAWADCPHLFCLAGYPHPDASKVRCVLFGAKGLIRTGLIVRRGDGLLEAAPENGGGA